MYSESVMIIITGGAGFIGSNLLLGLNQMGYQDIWVVDDLTEGAKFTNLNGLHFTVYEDKGTFLSTLEALKVGDIQKIQAIFHQGACSDTTEWNGKYMMENNFTYSKKLLDFAQNHRIPFYYASSAATYGQKHGFTECLEDELPINVYGFSKWQFDQYVRSLLPTKKAPIVGFRYFNVYGPREQHKGKMASVAFHHYQEMKATGKVKLFGAYDGYEAGMQSRDFVYVRDVVDVNLWFFKHPQYSGIFNLGTGHAQPFWDIAQAAIGWFKKGIVEFIDFPAELKGHYQSFTEANLTLLRETGCNIQFKTLKEAIPEYYDWIVRQ